MAKERNQVMGKVIAFPGATPPVNEAIDTGFLEEVKAFDHVLSESIPGVINAIAKLCKLKPGRVREPLPIAPSIPQPPYGVVYAAPIKPTHNMVIATSPDFPRYLNEVQGLNFVESQRFAANYVTAFSVVAGALQVQKRLARIPGAQDFQKDLWPKHYHSSSDREHNDNGVSLALPFRFAGTVALHETSLDLSLPETIPDKGLPQHIAGIFNPLSEFDVMSLSTVLEAPRIVQ